MHDHELDELLRRGATRPSAGAVAAATELAERTRPRAGTWSLTARPASRRSWARRPLLVAGVLAGAVVLSGAGTLAAYQMGIPPFQTIPDGIQRLDTPIPLDYERTDGGTVRCKVFMEFQDLTSAQLRRIDDAVASEDWTPERQRQLIGRPADAGVPRSQSQVLTDALDTNLEQFAAGVVPELLDYQNDGVEGEQPSFNGHAASCREIQK